MPRIPMEDLPLDADLTRRLHRALTAGKEELYVVLSEGNEAVIRAALRNPALDEEHLLALLKRRDLSEDFLAAVYALPATGESHRLKVALVHNPVTPGRIVLALLPHLYLMELVAICDLAGGTPDQKVAAERAILQRLQVTPLGSKITLARRVSPAIVEALLKEGDPRLVETCLGSPKLKESAVFQFITGGRATTETIAMVARHPKWKGRPNLCAAMLKSPKTSAACFESLLPAATLGDLKTIAATGALSEGKRKLVAAELRRRGVCR